MSDPLLVLIVDDSPSDAKLVTHVLRRAFPAVETQRVDAPDAMRTALGNRRFGAILSDWTMPKFNARGALGVMQDLGLDLPFIIFSGTVPEASALDAMRAGAHDYVLKDQPTRLVPALERELRECDERRARRAADRALKASEARFQRLTASGIVGIGVAARPGDVLEANQALLDMLGFTREEFESGVIDWRARTPPEWRKLDQRAMDQLYSEGVAHAWEKELYRKDGTRVAVLVALTIFEAPNYLMLVSDLSAQKRVEEALAKSQEQLRQSQKMEAIGRLAGGIAHDFNNMLSVILGQGELIIEELPAGDPLREEVGEIRKAGLRAAELTKQLLLFSRQQMIQPRVLDLNEVVASLDKMLVRIVGEDIDILLLEGSDLYRVCADPGHIHQVIMNLVVNARDAMPTGGKLTIETKNVTLDESFVQFHLGARAGNHVMLAVTDTGIGMDRATQARAFEPFFTTKEKGKGTGLGLSMVFGIVQQSGGTVWLYSEPGVGTTFKVYLPSVDAEPAPEKEAGNRPARRGNETVLLVEDDDQVRGVVKGMLARNGYTVVEARGPAEALSLSERYQSPVHLLLTDVVMPGMNGPELVRKIGPTRPDMKVLLMSGYTDDTVLRHGVVDEVAFIQKPIIQAVLMQMIGQLLETKHHPSERET